MKKLRSYDPDKPYTIKSGKREGKSLGVLMFNEYSFLRWHFGEMEKRYTTGTDRKIFKLEGRMTKNKAFNFFKE